MDEWQGSTSVVGIVSEAQRRQHTAFVTPEGAAWLASASAFPRSVEAPWSARPGAPTRMLGRGTGDGVPVPPLYQDPAADVRDGAGISRWVVAPDTRHPWLPGADVLLWACVRAARTAPAAALPALAGVPGSA